MKLAIVRGPQLSPFEVQTYEPLLGMGFEVTAFASKRPIYAASSRIPVVQLRSPWDDVQRLPPGLRQAREWWSYRRGDANALRGLEDALRGFDVLQPMETFNSFTAQCLDVKARSAAKVVVTVWENIPHLRVEPAMARQRARTLREADAFIAVTGRARDALVIEGARPERVHVVPVGLDLETFRPRPRSEDARPRWGLPQDGHVILFAARLVPEKGLVDVLHALRMLDDEGHAPIWLLVVGDGPQRAAAEARARELGIRDRVVFAGPVPYARMAEAYAVSDAFVLASLPTPRWEEQFGMVLVEAMACGVPVVATASGSIPEVVGNAAALAQPGDARSIASCLARALAEGPEMSKRGLDRARAEFDREKVAVRLAALYRSVSPG